jgi:hypothetical protein
MSSTSVALRGPDGHIRQDLLLIPTASFTFGFVSGLMTSSRFAGKQFLAENAHRLPTTVQGSARSSLPSYKGE